MKYRRLLRIDGRTDGRRQQSRHKAQEDTHRRTRADQEQKQSGQPLEAETLQMIQWTENGGRRTAYNARSTDDIQSVDR